MRKPDVAIIQDNAQAEVGIYAYFVITVRHDDPNISIRVLYTSPLPKRSILSVSREI